MPVAPTLWKAVDYKPHEKQLLFHQSKARFKVAVCGRRFGKSRMAAAEVLTDLLSQERAPTRGWIVGPQYAVGEKEFRYLWDDVVIHMGLGQRLKRKAYNVRTGEMYMEMPWGSRADVMSADHPDGLIGEGLDWVIVSEAAKQSPVIWEKYIRPALADRHGRAIFPSTPEGFNWFHGIYRDGQRKDQLYCERCHGAEWESWNFPSWENPYVYPGGFQDSEIQSQLRSADDPWFWQELGADFRSMVGLIYGEWSDEVHVKQHVYDPALKSQLWFDFGYSNPFVALDVQITPNDDVYIWREYYVKQKPVHIHAQELAQRRNPPGYHIDIGFGDSADPAAVETLGRALCPTVAMPEAKEVMQGIQEVKRWLRSPHGPKLFVDPSCVNTISEFGQYKLKEPRSMKIMENLKEEPKKIDDHAMDAIRYGIMHQFVLGADSHLDRTMVPAPSEADRGIFTWGDTPLIGDLGGISRW